MTDRIRNMLLLNVVCFGAWDDDLLHGHVLSALNSSTGPGFHLDKRPAGLEPGMLEREALVTYVPAHGGWLKGTGTSALWGKDVGDSFSEFGIIGVFEVARARYATRLRCVISGMAARWPCGGEMADGS
jgi:hypothetical protein